MEVDASSAVCVCLVVDGAAASWRLAVVAKVFVGREDTASAEPYL